jgi:hypothetical protein
MKQIQFANSESIQEVYNVKSYTSSPLIKNAKRIESNIDNIQKATDLAKTLVTNSKRKILVVFEKNFKAPFVYNVFSL